MHLMSDALMKEAMEVQESHHFGEQRHNTEHAYLSILTLAKYMYMYMYIYIYHSIYMEREVCFRVALSLSLSTTNEGWYAQKSFCNI